MILSKQVNWNMLKIVISIMGMTVCLLCGCGQDQKGSNQAELETAGTAKQQEQEELPDREDFGSGLALEPAEPEEEEPDYLTCMSGTVVEQTLTPEETEALFYFFIGKFDLRRTHELK